jgi:hypothetical protein
MVDGTVKLRPYISVIVRVVGVGEAGVDAAGADTGEAAAEKGAGEAVGEYGWGVWVSVLQPIRLILRIAAISISKIFMGILFFTLYSIF